MKLKGFFALFLVFLLGCATAGNGTFLNLLPESKEIEIGKSYIPYSIEEFDGLYPDKRVQEYVRSVGMTLAKHAERRLPYEFFVVNSSQVNAFALPGGPVFITRGLLLKLNSEGELAGVLAHELGHINARHHAKFLEKQFGISLLLNIGAILLADKPYGQALLQFGQIGGSLLALKFSRDQEREADAYAVKYTLRSGYDPYGIVRVFYTFKSMERSRPPEWLSTHPLPETRIREVEAELNRIKPSGALITDTEDFHQIKALLEKTKPSFDEYEKGRRALRNKDSAGAMAHFKRAVELYPDNYQARAYLAYLLARSGDLSSADLHARKALETQGEVFLTNFVYGYVSFLGGNYGQAVKSLERAKRLIPDYADTYYYLGRSYEAHGDIKQAVEHYRIALELSRGKAEWSSDARERLRRLGGL
ncbi:MAG: tetratricopeptide repeat protein [Aquificota bacterium]|nr:MAG: tetratricopeptide repeat protein [Aquificota bacterium]